MTIAVDLGRKATKQKNKNMLPKAGFTGELNTYNMYSPVCEPPLSQ